MNLSSAANKPSSSSRGINLDVEAVCAVVTTAFQPGIIIEPSGINTLFSFIKKESPD